MGTSYPCLGPALMEVPTGREVIPKPEFLLVRGFAGLGRLRAYSHADGWILRPVSDIVGVRLGGLVILALDDLRQGPQLPSASVSLSVKLDNNGCDLDDAWQALALMTLHAHLRGAPH